MKWVYLILVITVFNFCGNKSTKSQTKKPELNLKVILKGSYKLSQSDSNYYFLIEALLINNSDSLYEFLTLSCSLYDNLLVDPKKFIICGNDCYKNSTRLIKLKPKQSLNIPFILQTKSEDTKIDNQIKIGFILLDNSRLGDDDIYKLLLKMKENHENVIWSDPIILYKGTGQTYRID